MCKTEEDGCLSVLDTSNLPSLATLSSLGEAFAPWQRSSDAGTVAFPVSLAEQPVHGTLLLSCYSPIHMIVFEYQLAYSITCINLMHYMQNDCVQIAQGHTKWKHTVRALDS